jgi:proliferating cell nuclear antigen
MSSFHAIVNIGRLQTYLDTIGSIVDEATFHISRDGIYTQPRDPSNVSVVNQTLAPRGFEAFEAEDFRIGLNLNTFEDYLSKGRGTEVVELEYDDETRRLNIELGDAAFSMAGIDPDSVRQGTAVSEMGAIDEDALVADVTMDGAALSHGIDVAGTVSDHVLFESDPDRENPFHIVGEGDTDDGRVRYGRSLHEGSEVNGEAASLFSREYMQEFASVLPDTDPVRLRHGEEWPLVLTYEYADGAADVTMVCAPRIDSS